MDFTVSHSSSKCLQPLTLVSTVDKGLPHMLSVLLELKEYKPGGHQSFLMFTSEVERGICVPSNSYEVVKMLFV